MADTASYEDMDKLLNNKEDLILKNRMIKAPFREVRALVRQLTYTEEAKLYEDFAALKNKIHDYHVPGLNHFE